MHLRSAIASFAWTVAAGVVFTAGATALEPGVTVNPGSPSGKEYAFPLAVVRGQSVGHVAPQGVAVPRFGSGIAPARPTGVRGGATGVHGGAASSSRSTTPAAGIRTNQAAGSSAPARTHTSSSTAVRSSAAIRAKRSHQVSGAPGAQSTQNAQLASLVRPRSTTSQIALILLPVLLGGLAVGAVIAVIGSRRR